MKPIDKILVSSEYIVHLGSAFFTRFGQIYLPFEQILLSIDSIKIQKAQIGCPNDFIAAKIIPQDA